MTEILLTLALIFTRPNPAPGPIKWEEAPMQNPIYLRRV